jgi:hypothetical protein
MMRAWEAPNLPRFCTVSHCFAFEGRSGSSEVRGTLFQRAVTCAAGPVWDEMNDRYLRTSAADEAGIQAAVDAGYERGLLFAVASAMLAMHASRVRDTARETLPPGPIQGIG